jgi:lipoprotein NlpD
LVSPYPIKIGQKLILPNGAKEKVVTDASDVVVTPIKIEPDPSEVKSTPSNVTPILNQPKAIREAYSLEAYNKVTPATSSKPIEVATTKTSATAPAADNANKPSDIKPTADTKPLDDEGLRWSWPTNGKVIANFSEAANKGIDIAGAMAQPINAASAGKVIYSGSDLRGYGKLVIIKHNKTYLSVYAHNSRILVKEGQQVAAGQKIAEMGNSDSSSIKLHFEIRRQGKSVDPMKFLN